MPLPPTDDLRGTKNRGTEARSTENRLDSSPRGPLIADRRKAVEDGGKKAALVVIADEDTDSNRAIARLRFGCNDRSCLVLVNSHFDMVKKLREYDQIDRLVFLLHGIPGNVKVKGDPKQWLSLSDLAKLLEGTKTVVQNEIVFEGCNVFEIPAAVLSFMNVLRAPRISGYAASHAWNLLISFSVDKSDTAETLNARLEKSFGLQYKEYLIPNQPDVTALAKKPGRHKLYWESFSRDIPLEQKFPVSQTDRYLQWSRKRLVKKTYTAEQARTAVGDLQSIGIADPLYEVTILASPLPAKKP